MRNLKILLLLIVSAYCKEEVSEPRQAYGPVIQDEPQINPVSQFQQKGRCFSKKDIIPNSRMNIFQF